jgi:LacI family transcriptional regulator, galactose operon repressor
VAKSRRKVSIIDVATAAGVSPTTVSHVLSGKRPVSEETERRVRATIESLGYIPSHAAQSLRSGSMRTVGVLVPDITNFFFAKLIAGVEDAASEAGFTTIVGNSRFDAERELRHLKTMAQRGVDALVYVAGAPPPAHVLQTIAAQIPIALADEEIASVSTSTTVADHRKGGRLLGGHLSGLGHESALVISGPPSLASCRERLAGFRDAFDGSALVVDADYLEVGGFTTVQEHPPDGDRTYTAICALNDLMAMGALAALRDLGYEVPEDVSVVGFDDIAAVSVIDPPLTTIRQPAYEVGKTAATQLIKDINRGRRPGSTRHVLDVTLKVRHSTAPPGRTRTIARSSDRTATANGS